MYRVPPPPPDPLTAARQTIKNCSGIMIGVAAISVITMVVTVLQLSFRMPMTNIHSEQALEIQRSITHWICVVGLSWGAISAGWGILNWWGLKGMHGWSRISSIVYSFFLLFTCFGATFGGFLLYLLLKRDVKAAFAAGPVTAPPPV